MAAILLHGCVELVGLVDNFGAPILLSERLAQVGIRKWREAAPPGYERDSCESAQCHNELTSLPRAKLYLPSDSCDVSN